MERVNVDGGDRPEASMSRAVSQGWKMGRGGYGVIYGGGYGWKGTRYSLLLSSIKKRHKRAPPWFHRTDCKCKTLDLNKHYH